MQTNLNVGDIFVYSKVNLTGAIFADSIPPGTYTNCVMDLKHIATQKQIPAALANNNPRPRKSSGDYDYLSDQ